MKAMFFQPRVALAIVVSVVGVATSWLAGTLHAGGMGGLAWLSAPAFAAALCIGAVFVAGTGTSANSEVALAKRIIESMPGYAWSADPEGRFIYVSAKTLAYIGMPAGDLGPMPDSDEFGWRRTVHPDDYERVVARWRHCLKTGDHYDAEHRIRRADGAYRWFRNSGFSSRDSNGRITGWYGTTTDIDDQKQAEEALRRSEQRLQQLVDTVPALIWTATAEGTPTYVNKQFMKTVGVAVDSLTGPDALRSLADVHPDQKDAVEKELARSFEASTGFSMAFRQRRSDGTWRWTEVRAEPLRDGSGRVVQWYGVCIDIEDLMTAQEALRDRERELSQFVNLVPSLLWRLTPDGDPVFFSQRMTDFFGLDVGDTDKPDATPLAAVIQAVVHPDDIAGLSDALHRSFVTGERFSMRYRLRRADGVYRWMSGRAEPLRDESGRILQWYGLAHDIDDQVHAEEAVRRSERRLRQLIDAVPALIWTTTSDGTPSYVNKKLIDTVGVTVEDLIGPDASRSLADIHPDHKGAVGQALARSFETGDPFAMTYRQRRADGTWRWTEGRAEALRDETGKIVQWYGVCVDIEDLMVAQDAVRDRERELSQLVNLVPSFLWRLAPDGEPVFFSQRMIDFLGVDVADTDRPGMTRLAASMHSLVHPDDVGQLDDTLGNCLRTGEPFALKYRLRRADGVYRWMDGRGEPMRDQDGRIVQWHGLCNDIDDQMHAEQALRQSEQQLRQLVDAVPATIWCTAPDGTPTYRSKRHEYVTGVVLAEFAGHGGSSAPMTVIAHPDDKDAAAQVRARAFETGTSYVVRYRQIRRDGSYRWTESRAEPLRDESGAILQWYGVSVDVHDMVKAQDALRERERELLQLVETLPALIYCAAPNGEPTYRSRQLREYLGFDVHEKEGPDGSRLAGTLTAVIHPDDVAGVQERYAHSLKTGEPYMRKHRLRRFDGEYRWVETRAAAMRDAEGAIVQWNGICLDIEEQVRTQEDLRLAQESLARASQAASLAELSASIAHEVNQPLAAVVANSYACQRWLKCEPPNLERAQITADRIIRDANAASDVVSRIRALFKQAVETRNCTSLPSVISEAQSLMAEEAARRGIRMDADVEDDLPLVAFDRVQIQQVLINLIRNGMDAMDGVAADRVIGIHVRRLADGVRAEISDRGRGIAFPDRIFEPFFTTKEQGMGMGLAICRSIVESHGGRLWAERNDPQGSSFIFTLPVGEKAAQ